MQRKSACYRIFFHRRLYLLGSAVHYTAVTSNMLEKMWSDFSYFLRFFLEFLMLRTCCNLFQKSVKNSREDFITFG